MYLTHTKDTLLHDKNTCDLHEPQSPNVPLLQQRLQKPSLKSPSILLRDDRVVYGNPARGRIDADQPKTPPRPYLVKSRARHIGISD
jgi:hypothetical protein